MTLSMSPRADRLATTKAALVAWAMWLVAFAFAVAGVATSGPQGTVGVSLTVISALSAVSAITVGAILVGRLPRHRIGWLLVAGGLAAAVQLAASGLGYLGTIASPGSVPGAVWLVWVSNWVWTPYIVLLAFFLPLFFPTGRLPSPRWRPAAAIGVVAIVAGAIQGAFSPFPVADPPPPANPLAASGWLLDALSVVGLLVTLSGLLFLPLAAASLVVRYRHASGIERAQLKWFAYVVALMTPAFLVALLLSGYTTGALGAISNVAWGLALLGLGLLPAAIGLAVLRFRLYEIDRLISRTLVYGALTATLALVYVASILVLQGLLAPLTSSNELAVAGSTLVVAALFGPVRRRIQALVDRHFFRARYDAARELAALGARLRDEVDLAQVRADIQAVVERTLQPTVMSVWLRAPRP